MIFTLEHLQGIRSGEIQLAFRRWKRARVKQGSLIRTEVCTIRIDDVSIVQENTLELSDARKAGFNDVDQLLAASSKYQGDLYKIQLSYYSEDPRIALRQQSLNEALFLQITQKLQRLDRSSKDGPWTRSLLRVIIDNPHVRAAELGKILGMEKIKLKLNIRKLKNLGLTISHEIGYEISPLGRQFMERVT